MDPQLTRAHHPRLTMDESAIVQICFKNLHGSRGNSLSAFQLELERLRQITTDPCLHDSIQSLQRKIRYLSGREFQALYQDALSGRIKTENYPLPYFAPDDFEPKNPIL